MVELRNLMKKVPKNIKYDLHILGFTIACDLHYKQKIIAFTAFFPQSFLYILCTTFLMHSYKKSWNCCSFVFTEIRSWYFNPILLKGFCLLRCKITRFDSIKIFTAHIWYKCKYQIFPISNVPIWYLVYAPMVLPI